MWARFNRLGIRSAGGLVCYPTVPGIGPVVRSDSKLISQVVNILLVGFHERVINQSKVL